jgi:hypothetical protein
MQHPCIKISTTLRLVPYRTTTLRVVPVPAQSAGVSRPGIPAIGSLGRSAGVGEGAVAGCTGWHRRGSEHARRYPHPNRQGRSRAGNDTEGRGPRTQAAVSARGRVRADVPGGPLRRALPARRGDLHPHCGHPPPGPVVASAPLPSGPDATVTPPLPEVALGGTTDGRIGFRAQPPTSDLSAMPARMHVQPPVERYHGGLGSQPPPSQIARRQPGWPAASSDEDTPSRFDRIGLPHGRGSCGSVLSHAAASAPARRACVPLLWGDLDSVAVVSRAWPPLDVQAGERGRFPASPSTGSRGRWRHCPPASRPAGSQSTDRCHLDNSDGSSGAPEKEARLISAISQRMALPRVASELVNAIVPATRA